MSASHEDLRDSSLELMDVGNSSAFMIIDDMLKSGGISGEDAISLKRNYEEIHDNILKMYEEEKQALRKAKNINQDLLGEKIKLEKMTIKRHEESHLMISLEKERDEGFVELSTLREQTSTFQYELIELERQHSDVLRSMEVSRKTNADMVEPEFQAARDSIKVAEDAIHEQSRLTDVNSKEKERLLEKKQQLGLEIQEKKELLGQKKQLLNKVKADPERIKKQSDVVEIATQNLSDELIKLKDQLSKCDAKIEDQAKTKGEVTEMGRDLTRKLELHRSTIEQRERDVDSVRKSLELEQSQNQDLLVQRVQVELAMKEERTKLKAGIQELACLKKEYEANKRTLKKRRAQFDNVTASIPQMEHNLNDTLATRNSYIAENKGLGQQLNGLKQEVDVFIANYLRQETIEADKKALLLNATEAVKDCEVKIGLWVEETHKQAKQMSMLGAQREIKAREATSSLASHKNAVEKLRIKELTIIDLSKGMAETNNKLREFSALYDVVKNERNKYVNLIQASSQALAEMKEKIKILQNEVEILRNESASKDKSFTKEYLANQTSQCQRDAARVELNKWHITYKEKQNQVEQQIVEIDKLNSIINATEKSMLRLKRQYQVAVEQRNYTGVQLIDRNDELCILYEKSNIQEDCLKKGEAGLRNRDDEMRIASLQVAELERSLLIARKKIPQVPQVAETILALKKSLEDEKNRTEKLCEELETPENEDRWRALLGEDPDIDQLQAKLQILKERFNMKKEMLLEKELVLEEVTELSSKLKIKASEGKEETMILAKSVNNVQCGIKEVTRKMMAVVSELSMYQATAMKLEQEKQDRETELDEAQQKLINGLPPTEDAEFQWYRYENKLQQQAKDHLVNALRFNENDPFATSRKTNVRSTAEPRPTAYIPENSIGIPKPYGALAPFKPSEPGANMRHMRPPQEKEIVL